VGTFSSHRSLAADAMISEKMSEKMNEKIVVTDDSTEEMIATEPLTADNMLWAETVVASGTCVGVVVYTGPDTRFFCLFVGIGGMLFVGVVGVVVFCLIV